MRARKQMESNRNIRFLKSLLLLAVLAFGILFLGTTYLLAYRDNFFNNSLFWMSIIIICSSTFIVILDRNISETYKIFTLFLFGFALYLPHVLGSPDHFRFWDELAHLQHTNQIYHLGKAIDIKLTIFPVASSFPGLELLTVSLRFTTGLSTFQCGTLLIGLIHSILLVFLYLFFKTVSHSERIAALGAFTYVANDSYTYFDAAFSYESLGLLFLTLSIFILSKRMFNGNIHKRHLSSVLIVILPALVITHHLTSYVLMSFISLMAVFSVVKKSIKVDGFHNFLLLMATLVFGWVTFVAISSIPYYSQQLMSTFIKLIKSSPLFEERVHEFISQPFHISTFPYYDQPYISTFPYYETFIQKFLYFPLTLLFFVVGIFSSKQHKKISNIFTLSMGIIGFLLFLVLFLMRFLGGQQIGRLATFFFIGTSFFMGFGLEKLMYSEKNNRLSLASKLTKALSFLAVILILIGGIGIGIKPPHRSPGSLSPHAVGLDTWTSDVFYAADWFVVKAGRYNRVTSDKATFSLFRAYGTQYGFCDAQEVFYPKIINNNVTKCLTIRDIDYLIVDERISKLLPDVGYYFERTERDLKDYSQPIPIECLDKFDKSSFFYKLYDNGNVSIYKFSNATRAS